jgi:hypothetical protein
MTNYHDTDPDGMVESYRIDDIEGDLWAVLSYFPPGDTPSHRYETWVVDFADGHRLTGEVATKIAHQLLDQPGTSGSHSGVFEGQADSILDTVVYDDDSRMWRITVGSLRVWFKDCQDSGNDVVLYVSSDCDSRAGMIEDAPFDAADLSGQMAMARRQVSAHV